MRQTLLHLDRPLTGPEHERLCAALSTAGAGCRTADRSEKPHLMFVAYDEMRSSPADLVRLATASGHVAHVVDL